MRWINVNLVLTVSDVLGLVPLSRNLLYDALRSGDLPAARVGSKYFIARENLIVWLGMDPDVVLRNDETLGAEPESHVINLGENTPVEVAHA